MYFPEGSHAHIKTHTPNLFLHRLFSLLFTRDEVKFDTRFAYHLRTSRARTIKLVEKDADFASGVDNFDFNPTAGEITA